MNGWMDEWLLPGDGLDKFFRGPTILSGEGASLEGGKRNLFPSPLIVSFKVMILSHTSTRFVSYA